MPRPAAIEFGSWAESVDRVWKLTSLSMLARMRCADICFKAAAIFGSTGNPPMLFFVFHCARWVGAVVASRVMNSANMAGILQRNKIFTGRLGTGSITDSLPPELGAGGN